MTHKLSERERALIVELDQAVLRAKARTWEARTELETCQAKLQGALSAMVAARGITGPVRLSPDATEILDMEGTA